MKLHKTVVKNCNNYDDAQLKESKEHLNSINFDDIKEGGVK